MRRSVAFFFALAGAATARADDLVTLHVEGATAAVVERLQPLDGDGRWALVCVSPCVAQVRRQDLIRIARTSYMLASEPIDLHPVDGAVTLTIEAGRPKWQAIGLVVGVAGSISAGAGLLAAVAGAVVKVQTCFLSPCTDNAGDVVAFAGLAAFGVGFLSSIVGWWTYAINRRTTIDQNELAPATTSDDREARLHRDGLPHLPPVVGLSLFATSF